MSNLIEKLAKVTESLGSFQADKKHGKQNYNYISADQVLSRVGGALAAQGVMIIPAISEERMEEIVTKKGQTRYDALVSLEMTLTDGESSIVQQWLGRGSDYGVPDKALYKAITSGHKYFLMKLHNVGIGNEDGEHEEQKVTKPAPQQQSNGGKFSKRPYQPEVLKEAMQLKTKDDSGEMPDKKQAQWAAASLSVITLDDAERYALTSFLFGVESTKKLTAKQAGVITDWVKYNKIDDEWVFNEDARQEAALVIAELNKRDEEDGVGNEQQEPLFEGQA